MPKGMQYTTGALVRAPAAKGTTWPQKRPVGLCEVILPCGSFSAATADNLKTDLLLEVGPWSSRMHDYMDLPCVCVDYCRYGPPATRPPYPAQESGTKRRPPWATMSATATRAIASHKSQAHQAASTGCGPSSSAMRM
jgi:hypothetical protein